jgi:hypothetical protein
LEQWRRGGGTLQIRKSFETVLKGWKFGDFTRDRTIFEMPIISKKRLLIPTFQIQSDPKQAHEWKNEHQSREIWR